VAADGSGFVNVAGALSGPQGRSRRSWQIKRARNFDLRAHGIYPRHQLRRSALGHWGKIGHAVGYRRVNIQAAQLSEDAEGARFGGPILLRLDRDVPRPRVRRRDRVRRGGQTNSEVV